MFPMDFSKYAVWSFCCCHLFFNAVPPQDILQKAIFCQGLCWLSWGRKLTKFPSNKRYAITQPEIQIPQFAFELPKKAPYFSLLILILPKIHKEARGGVVKISKSTELKIGEERVVVGIEPRGSFISELFP